MLNIADSVNSALSLALKRKEEKKKRKNKGKQHVKFPPIKPGAKRSVEELSEGEQIAEAIKLSRKSISQQTPRDGGFGSGFTNPSSPQIQTSTLQTQGIIPTPEVPLIRSPELGLESQIETLNRIQIREFCFKAAQELNSSGGELASALPSVVENVNDRNLAAFMLHDAILHANQAFTMSQRINNFLHTIDDQKTQLNNECEINKTNQGRITTLEEKTKAAEDALVTSQQKISDLEINITALEAREQTLKTDLKNAEDKFEGQLKDAEADKQSAIKLAREQAVRETEIRFQDWKSPEEHKEAQLFNTKAVLFNVYAQNALRCPNLRCEFLGKEEDAITSEIKTLLEPETPATELAGDDTLLEENQEEEDDEDDDKHDDESLPDLNKDGGDKGGDKDDSAGGAGTATRPSETQPPKTGTHLALGSSHSDQHKTFEEKNPQAGSKTSAAKVSVASKNDSVLTIGYVMKSSREVDFAKRGAFPMYPTQNGLMFVPLSFDLPLDSQLQKVDAVLHKATDEISSIDLSSAFEFPMGISFSKGINDLVRYTESHPDFYMIDPLNNIYPLLDRHKIQHILLELEGLNIGTRNNLRAPRCLQVDDFSNPKLREQFIEAKLSLPVIVKPQVACGVADAHNMALVFKYEDFENLDVPLPAIIQEYIDHGSSLFKFYVLGDKVFHAVKKSMPNASNLLSKEEKSGSNAVLFNSLKSLPVSKEQASKQSLDVELVNDAARWLKIRLGLTIFGFDVVIQEGSRDHVIVDLNYLPSFKEVPDSDAIPAFWEAIKSSYELMKEKKKLGNLE